MTLEQESKRATQLLTGKTIAKVVRHNSKEVILEFKDGSRLLVDSETPVELSITNAGNPQAKDR